ncbi:MULTISPECIES: hypothetical protein [Pseudomonas syringae group]|nr:MULTISPECIES: hypothetical protein [Pseudomonas syringae group]MCK0551285.1 hypothetical protein [Pseudomonas syringae pv. aptata]UQW67372.1 hypothetical protein L2Y00_19005 [Pseudomonas avellanae]GGJ32629.1 hypothetical protein GCM10009085_28240 [Pseudomonas avellanae]SFP04310.1 hypothetical protein SAMN05444063_1442 [Pseudomonas syringae]
MSKTKTEPASTDLVITVAPRALSPASEPAQIDFRDTVFTSRTVVLPNGGLVDVAQGVASVDSSDADALAYLKAHEEFEPLE